MKNALGVQEDSDLSLEREEEEIAEDPDMYKNV